MSNRNNGDGILFFILIAIVLIYQSKDNNKKNIGTDIAESFSESTINDFILEMKELWDENFVNNIEPRLKDIADKEQLINEKDAIKEKLSNQLAAFQNNFSAYIDQLKSIDIGDELENSIASSCLGKLTDVYQISLPEVDAFSVHCDSSLVAGSGWTVIQRRQDGSVDFNRNWQDYREGFGDLRGEFFIGLEKLHQMTKWQPHELYIHIEDFENEQRYARYSEILIADEAASYELQILGEYSGNAGDTLSKYANKKFASETCDKSFESDSTSNQNGLYTIGNDVEPGVIWTTWHSNEIKLVQTMIRPKAI